MWKCQLFLKKTLNFYIICKKIQNKELSDEMYDDGYSDVINIDISDKAIDQMKALAIKHNRNMTCTLIYIY